jgi:KipI family sensor histidine kinase inhibitor
VTEPAAGVVGTGAPGAGPTAAAGAGTGRAPERRVLPCGDEALLVEVADLASVLALAAALRADPPPGIVEVVPAARTVLLRCDPGAAPLADVAAAVRALPVRPGGGVAPGAEVELPVVYDGPDLDDVARATGVPAAEVVRRHQQLTWTVAFCGFAPGFGYLVADGPWPDVPRRADPRRRVPAGALALAGPYSGVYPRESPGGWQLVGRCLVPVFDPTADPPAVLSPGTRVRHTAALAPG